MKNIRHDSPGLRYGTSQRKGQLSGVGEAVTQGWKGVNPAAAWQAGGGGDAQGLGGAGPPPASQVKSLEYQWGVEAWIPALSSHPQI